MCRAGAPADRRGDRAAPRSATWSSGPEPPAAARRARSSQRDVLEAYAAHLLSLAPGHRPPAQGRRRRRQRDGRAHRAGRSSSGIGDAGRAGADVLRARRHLPEPRGQPDRAGEPRRPAGAGASPRAPTSGWPSTATPTAASSSTSAASRSRPSTLTALIAARELAKEPGATVIHNLITSRVVPELVARARRHAGAHPGRALLHQGDDGRDRRGLRRRAQRALLLPRLLARRLRDAGRAAHAGRAGRDRPAAVGAARRLPALRRSAARSTPRSPTRPPSLAAVEAAYAGRDGRRGRPPRRAHRHHRRLVVQRPPVQHRAAAAPQRRGRRRRHHDPRPRRRPRPDQERTA